MVYDPRAPRFRGRETLMNRLLTAVFVLAAAFGAIAVHAQAPAKTDAAPVREVKSVAAEFKGNKIWTPATFIVKKGDHVKITLINTLPAIHAFAIEGYDVNVQVNFVDKDNTKVVEFNADKPGIFRIYCSMHAAHIGGQLVVLE
jgi:nitrosocyanin